MGQPLEHWEREGGEGLPPEAEFTAKFDDSDRKVFLFTCVNCGYRAATPPEPVTECSCGGEIVWHRFSPDEYQNIRHLGSPQ